jgi:hypothetical protein
VPGVRLEIDPQYGNAYFGRGKPQIQLSEAATGGGSLI